MTSLPNTVLKLRDRTVKGRVVTDDVETLTVTRGGRIEVVAKSDIVSMRHPRQVKWTREGTSAMARWLRWKDEALAGPLDEAMRNRKGAASEDYCLPLREAANLTEPVLISEEDLAAALVWAMRAMAAMAAHGIAVGPVPELPVDGDLVRAAEVHLT